MRFALPVAFVALLGCARADEKSLRRTVAERYSLYVDSRDHFVIDRCTIGELPNQELNWFRVRFPLHPKDRVPPIGRCSVRFDLDLGHGSRKTTSRDVLYLFVEGSWVRWRDEQPAR